MNIEQSILSVLKAERWQSLHDFSESTQIPTKNLKSALRRLSKKGEVISVLGNYRIQSPEEYKETLQYPNAVELLRSGGIDPHEHKECWKDLEDSILRCGGAFPGVMEVAFISMAASWKAGYRRGRLDFAGSM